MAGTRDIDGVECAIVHAVEFLEGEVIEDTFDYYAQNLTTSTLPVVTSLFERRNEFAEYLRLDPFHCRR